MNKEIRLPADELYVPVVELRAGDIRAVYEEGRLRYMSAGDTEIIRMIYPALRDDNWRTIIPVLSEEKISTRPRSFSISYSAWYEAEEIRYRAYFTIEGRSDNSIVFSMRGEAFSRFKKRRIGLCLLHPIESCSEKEIEVLQPDGTNYCSLFPAFVSPFQPFLNVRGMKWITGNGTLVEIGYEGDIFETEDQRNWSDNTYKTYCTPLTVPSPAMVNIGDTVEQKITVRAETKNTVFRKNREVSQGELKLPFPRIGYARGNATLVLNPVQASLLKEIPFDHYTVQLDLSGNWEKIFKDAVEEARQFDTRLELVINFDLMNDPELNAVTDAIKPSLKFVYSILILSAHHETAPRDFFVHAYGLIKKSLGDISTGYGCNTDFAGLNRNRPADIAYDFVNFHLQPQVHMTDNRSIMENLNSQETLIRSANKFTGGKPLHISTVTLGPADTVDKRFNTYFAAWWTLLAIRNMSAAQGISFYQLTGEMGVINGENTTPVYTVLRTIKDFSPKYILQNTGQKVILENESGDRLVFTSSLPEPDCRQ